MNCVDVQKLRNRSSIKTFMSYVTEMQNKYIFFFLKRTNVFLIKISCEISKKKLEIRCLF